MAFKLAILILDSSLYNQPANSHGFSTAISLILYSSLSNQPSDLEKHIKLPFHDSTIFQVDDWELKNFPLKTHMKFKLMTEDEICNLISHLAYTNQVRLSPNYWLTRNIIKSDSEYIVQLVEGGGVPKLDRNGKPYPKADGSPGTDTTHGCDFYPGLGFGITFKISSDTLVMKRTGWRND